MDGKAPPKSLTGSRLLQHGIKPANSFWTLKTWLPPGDGQDLLPAIERVEEHVGVTVERAIVDGAYGSGEKPGPPAQNARTNRSDLLSPMRRPTDPEVDKSAFSIDDQAQTATCPKGQTVPASNIQTDPHGRTACTFVFDRNVCETCPLFTRCVSQPNHRTHGNHLFLRSFPASRTPTPANRRVQTTLSPAPSHRGKQAELVSHGLRKTRYVGNPNAACSGSGWLPQ